MASLDPWAPATFAVAWAGETESLNWFHLARECTEKWHHQQQIREAVGQTEPLMTRELFQPLIETLMRGLPHAYRTAMAPLGTRVRVCIDTEIGSAWELERRIDCWQLQPPGNATPAAKITLAPEVAWKLFTKGLSPAVARAQVCIMGDAALAKAALHLVAVMG